ncbi:MAG: DUF4114 domain-containing protein [Candidatus Eisenbacteria bacterium]
MSFANARSLAMVALLSFPVAASAQVAVTFGTSWDGAANSLQNIVNAKYGSGAINVATDYIGHNAGQADPFVWQDLQFDAMILKEIAGNANTNYVGWYKETGVMPVIDGIDDGIVFTGPEGAGTSKFVFFSQPTKFGFYMNPNGLNGATNAPEPEKFFTNRMYNDIGPNGTALHPPLNGDVQALVYDLSGILHTPNVWLVCFEDLDSGANPGPCCATTDNDYNDFVFEVHALGTTPANATSLGRLKALYRN